jgi:aminopeptidase N
MIGTMKYFLTTGSLLIMLISCQKAKVEAPEKGVSIELNNHRKSILSKISYTLNLDIPAVKSEPIMGHALIEFNLSSAKEPLVIDFNTDSSHVHAIQSGDKAITYTFLNEHIVIAPEFLETGANELKIAFVAGDLSLNRNDNFLYTLFVPDRASTCFPLFDQPNLKATYKVTLAIPSGWEAISNGTLKERKPAADKMTFTFEETKPISSYLFAFAAGKFLTTTRHVNERIMTMYYRETDSVKVKNNLDDIFALHGKSIAWLEEYTNISYPFDKFDFVLLPSFQYGGMEHPGAIFYNESSLFLDEKASVNRRMGRASLIAHETAHMWFGDLVTMDWFNDVWMKEVFANFMAAKVVQPSFPEIDHNLRFLLSHYPSAYEIDRSAGANPILQPLTNLKNAGTLYGAIIYQKAPVVMRHLERRIGEDLMREGLREYLKTYSYGNAKWDDLIGIIDARTDDNLEAWSDVWVKTPGMPEYEWSASDFINQRRDTVSNRIWQQPLKIHRSEQSDTSLMINSEKPIRLKSTSPLNFLNTDGFSYGYFKMDNQAKDEFLSHPLQSSDPVFRASMWINCWEGMVRNDGPAPDVFIRHSLNTVEVEDNPLLIDFLLGNLQTVWWNFMPIHNRTIWQTEVERVLWKLVESTTDAGKKNSYFRTYRSLVNSDRGLALLESIWSGKRIITDLTLSEEDKIALALELALKVPVKQNEILTKQLENTKNPDRKERLRFVMPALSDQQTVRDEFFESLKLEKNREHEPWVLEALSYLHHPLRGESSISYLRPSLELLQEVQLTGDIFFPQRWLHNTFDGHSSTQALEIADDFLKNHPEYPPYLKNKILQATDGLKRAVLLNESQKLRND